MSCSRYEDDIETIPPAWLVDFLRENHPESLLHLFLSFGLKQHAVHLAKALLQQQPQLLLPLPLLDKLLSFVGERERIDITCLLQTE